MKKNFTFLIACTLLMTYTVKAGTDPLNSGNGKNLSKLERKLIANGFKSGNATSGSAGNESSSRQVNPANQQGIVISSMVDCGVPFVSTAQLSIPEDLPSGASHTIAVSGIAGATLGSDVFLTKVHIAGHHTWVGDLIISITAPNGAGATLMNRVGVNVNTTVGCGSNDFSFDVIPGTGADNGNTCNTNSPGISGTFSAASGYNLDSINFGGGSPNGTWTLFGSDNAASDTGGVDTLIMYFGTTASEFTYIVNGSSVDFSVPAAAGTTFFWNFGDGNGAAGDNNVTDNYAAAGSYIVSLTSVTSTDTCSTMQVVTAAAPLGIANSNLKPNDFLIAPNPASDKVDISIGKIQSVNAELIIYDAFGRTVTEEILKQGSFYKSFDVGDWSKGIYFVRVTDNSFSAVKKLVLK